MQNNTTRKLAAVLLALALVLGAFAGCTAAPASSAPVTSSEAGSDTAGLKNITLKVVDKEGASEEFAIATEAENLRGALEQENLIEGDESEYGLYVKTVNGVTADEGNEEWWCLTKGGEMWNYGVDDTEIADGDVFEFTLTVGY